MGPRGPQWWASAAPPHRPTHVGGEAPLPQNWNHGCCSFRDQFLRINPSLTSTLRTWAIGNIIYSTPKPHGGSRNQKHKFGNHTTNRQRQTRISGHEKNTTMYTEYIDSVRACANTGSMLSLYTQYILVRKSIYSVYINIYILLYVQMYIHMYWSVYVYILIYDAIYIYTASIYIYILYIYITDTYIYILPVLEYRYINIYIQYMDMLPVYMWEKLFHVRHENASVTFEWFKIERNKSKLWVLLGFRLYTTSWSFNFCWNSKVKILTFATHDGWTQKLKF